MRRRLMEGCSVKWLSGIHWEITVPIINIRHLICYGRYCLAGSLATGIDDNLKITVGGVSR